MRTDPDRLWVADAIRLIEADFNRSADTHLLRLPMPSHCSVSIYLKDESTHPTGSLKHRLARSLILYALCNGWIGPRTALVEASSGSTAVSEAYFAQMLGLRFLAVMPKNTAVEKLAAIRHYGGECHFTACHREVAAKAAELALETGGHFIDQFTYAERATDWRGNNNIAESIFSQMAQEDHPVPAWIVAGAGTGGTTSTIGRYIRYRRLSTQLCLADPEQSVFHAAVTGSAPQGVDRGASCIEGIGRLRLEPSFNARLIDRAAIVADHSSIGAARAVSQWIGRPCGGSTGTNVMATIALAREMSEAGCTGSIVTLLCDSGARYGSTYFNPDWLALHGGAWEDVQAAVLAYLKDGTWSDRLAVEVRDANSQSAPFSV